MKKSTSMLSLVRCIVSQLKLTVNGNPIPLNDFAERVVRDILLALLRNLRGAEIDTITAVDVS
ncbi:MAG: hypothetical protein HXY34_06365 [Candidatus Thorarchaeota archaeon]|nr:hypothetical protein [Candidatus Thorarchaeota archaeon]